MNPKELMSIDELVEIQNKIIEDTEYDLKKARSPKSKRACETSLKYHRSLKHHLTQLKTQ